MVAQKHGNSLPLPFMRTQELCNGNLADAKIVQTYGGNNRFLREWVMGETIVDNPPVAPNTPQRAYGLGTIGPGHDHSGGVMGRPFVHTLWSAIWGYPSELITGANLDGGVGPRMRVTVGYTTQKIYEGFLRTLWIPNCAPGGCYFSALLTVVAYASAACTLQVKYETGSFVDSEDIALSGAAINSISKTTKVFLQPGRLQLAKLTLTVLYTAATSDVTLMAGGLHQTKADA